MKAVNNVANDMYIDSYVLTERTYYAPRVASIETNSFIQIDAVSCTPASISPR